MDKVSSDDDDLRIYTFCLHNIVTMINVYTDLDASYLNCAAYCFSVCIDLARLSAIARTSLSSAFRTGAQQSAILMSYFLCIYSPKPEHFELRAVSWSMAYA